MGYADKIMSVLDPAVNERTQRHYAERDGAEAREISGARLASAYAARALGFAPDVSRPEAEAASNRGRAPSFS